jgi:hypothetical protein
MLHVSGVSRYLKRKGGFGEQRQDNDIFRENNTQSWREASSVVERIYKFVPSL